MSLIPVLRFIWRVLRRSPGTSLVAIIALGLGIGLTTAMFSIVDGMVWTGLPFEDAERLVHLESNDLGRGQASLAVYPHDFLDWQARQTSFEGLAAFDQTSFNLSGDASFPERYRGARVSWNTFALLRIDPLLGRDFAPEDATPGAADVAVIGYDLWRQRFGGERRAVGSSIHVNGALATIVGVMPPGFEFPEREDVWTPLRLDGSAFGRGAGEGLEVLGRLRAETDLGKARTELEAIAGQLARLYPESNAGRGAVVKPYQEEFIGADTARLYFAMLAAAGCVLLIACTNVASLLLGRSLSRARELAIRTALGARRWRVVGRLIAENMVLAAAGAVLGLGIAWAGIRLFVQSQSFMPAPFWVRVTIDPRVLGFVLATTLAAGLVSGLLPALHASRVDVLGALKDSAATGIRMGRLSRYLVITEIALACALLVATSLLVRTVVNFHTVDPGFATDGIFTAGLTLPTASYPDPGDRVAAYDRLLAEVKSLPEVDAATLMSDPPGTVMGFTYYSLPEQSYDSLADYPFAFMGVVSPEFFDLFEIPLSRGRLFESADRLTAPPVVVVNRSFAERVWPDEDPIGRRLRFGRGDPSEPWRTVVGVVPDAGIGVLARPERGAGFYVPQAQTGLGRMSLGVRSRLPEAELAALLRTRVRAVDPHLPLYEPRSMERLVVERTFTVRRIGTFMSVFGAAALVLAALGIYGVLMFSVRQRRHEIGIRLALGARPLHIGGMVLRGLGGTLAIGVVLGLGLAAAGRGAIVHLLYHVEATDPGAFLTAVVVLSAVAFAASLGPAQRAARVDPIETLRSE